MAEPVFTYESTQNPAQATQERRFDIERFMDGSGKLDLSDIDWSEVPKHRITPEALRAIRYFMTTENSTFFYTKALMQTKAAIYEPELAPFICVWMYEEEFHGRAFRRFLDAYGEKVPASYRAASFERRGFGERFDEVGQAILSRIFADGWPAVHMFWGVIQEFTTYQAYQALIDRVDHPVLNVICQRIMKQEMRHYAFYRDHAKRRLQGSLSTQKLVTYALKVGWTPVGDGMSPKEDVVHAIRFLFDGLDGTAIAKIENKMRELPGLEWFDLFTKFAAEHQIRRAPASWFSQRATAQPAPSAQPAQITG